MRAPLQRLPRAGAPASGRIPSPQNSRARGPRRTRTRFENERPGLALARPGRSLLRLRRSCIPQTSRPARRFLGKMPRCPQLHRLRKLGNRTLPHLLPVKLHAPSALQKIPVRRWIIAKRTGADKAAPASPQTGLRTEKYTPYPPGGYIFSFCSLLQTLSLGE